MTELVKKFVSTGDNQSFGNRVVATPPSVPNAEGPKTAPTPPKPQVPAGKVSIQKGAQAASTPPSSKK